MVEEQIVKRGITDEKVIDAMGKVPREEFVPDNYKPYAYIDSPLPIGYEQTISQPFIVALMTYLIDLEGGKKVLEIGTGSGYGAAVLAEIAEEVYTIEILKPLAETAEERLTRLGYDNIKVRCGDGFFGWEDYAPYDAIVVTCAPGYIPRPLVDQLKIGGKMIIPVGESFQELLLVTKTEEGIKEESIIPVRFVPMKGEAEKRK
ncbi:MAG: protein-L-isoaspartate O-methyltransferase [bacterium (Candidatus Stahlbacteria) CG08_land_8_20_14_0_20_40_26]|nr:MAG: protein-L-isoaspartate O-methyltransferase [bacterium (Candidatus Stahlbacteria) CG23_combo_of_CG06-09_8_20_14_all_40_9]PIS26318.1 MAG: protein-L-isoaspartate O-methyltransferase [bacterium (Candidatus Stahlbacteria) CG08_land_8_20_14_0_20_40_26]